MKHLALITTTFLAILLASGCASLTPDQKAARVQGLSYAAASIGTAAALDQKPEWRPAFELALKNLSVLVDSKQITGQQLRDILATLPVKELNSRTARIAIDSATMLFDTLTGEPIDLTKTPYILAAATGIRDGMKVGLGN